jgi:hypothetical protein
VSAFWSDPVLARLLVCSIASVGLIVSSVEWLVPPSKLGRTGLLASGAWGVTAIGRAWRPAGLRLVFGIRIACALAFLAAAMMGVPLPRFGIALFFAALLSLPLRYVEPVGVFAGMDGAERLLIAVILAAGGSFIFASPLAVEAALVFIAGQAMIDYASAGWTKLREAASWTSGISMQRVLSSAHYGHPGLASLARRQPAIGRVLSVAMIALEIAVPFALVLPPPVAEGLLVVALGFHLAAAAVMGLNTFVWSFAATYPAILHCRNLLLR